MPFQRKFSTQFYLNSIIIPLSIQKRKREKEQTKSSGKNMCKTKYFTLEVVWLKFDRHTVYLSSTSDSRRPSLIKLNNRKQKVNNSLSKSFLVDFLFFFRPRYFVSFTHSRFVECLQWRYGEKKTTGTFADEFSKWKQFHQLFTILSPCSDSLIVIVFLLDFR